MDETFNPPTHSVRMHAPLSGPTYAVPPFRTVLRTATPSEIEQRNVAEDRDSEARYRDVETSVQRTARPLLELSLREMQALCDHPDERVRLAFLEAYGLTRNSFAGAQHEQMVRVLLRDAEAEGVAWTPLLDRIAVGGVWPQVVGEDGRESLGSPLDQARKLAEWLATRASDAEASELLGAFRAREIEEVFAEFYRDLTPKWLDRLEDRKTTRNRSSPVPAWMEAAVRNRQLPADTVDYLATVARAQIEAGHSAQAKPVLLGLVATGYRLPQEVRGFLAERASGSRPAATIPIQVLLEDRSTTEDELLAIARRASESAQEMTLLVTHRAARERVWNAVLKPDAGRALRVLARRGRLHPKLVERIHALHGEDLQIQLLLVEREDTPVEVIRSMVRSVEAGADRSILVGVSRRTRLRRDEEVRRSLLGVDDTRVRANLLRDGDPADFAALFRALAADAPTALLGALDGVSIPDGCGLTPLDVAPLLQSDTPEMRVAAIGVLGRISGADEDQPMAFQVRRSNGRPR